MNLHKLRLFSVMLLAIWSLTLSAAAAGSEYTPDTTAEPLESAISSAAPYQSQTEPADPTQTEPTDTDPTDPESTDPEPTDPDPTPTVSITDFADISADAWYYTALSHCVDNGYFYGTSQTAFSPNHTMNRAMLVTVLHRHAGEPEALTPAAFPDVPADSWYTNAVAWAAENGIVTGYQDGTFRPGSPISRQEIMVMFQRYVTYLGGDPVAEDLRIYTSFLDTGWIYDWSRPAVQWCTSVGIICGNNGYISPKDPSTRAQVATVLMRLDAYLTQERETITATCGEGGSVIPSGTFQVVPGASITFRIVPDARYLLQEATLNGVSQPEQTMYTVYSAQEPQTLAISFCKSVADPYSGYGQLVNRTYPIPNAASYKPSDLKKVRNGNAYNVQLRAEAADAADRMIDAYLAANPGSTLYAQSGYRSNSTQVYLYNRQISRKNGNIYAAGVVSAIPGTSEHELGLAVDLTVDGTLYQSFGSTRQGKWLAAHCMEYGFILRYPADKERITGIFYEPWHFRYVGTEIANDMKAQGVTTLEEYYGLHLADKDLTPYLPYLN